MTMTGIPTSRAATGAQRMYTIMGPQRLPLSLALTLRLLQLGCQGGALAITLWAIGQLATGAVIEGRSILALSLSLLLLLMAQYLFCLWAFKLTYKATQDICTRLRLGLFTHLKFLPQSELQRRDSGDLSNLFAVDLEMIEAFLNDGLTNALQGVVIPLMVLGYLFYLDPVIALPLALSLLAAVPVLLAINTRLIRLASLRQDSQAQASARIVEFALGAKIMRAFGAKSLFQAKFDRALDEFRDISLEMVARLGYPMALFSTVALLGIPLTYLATAYTWERLSAATLIPIVFTLFVLYAPIRAVLAAAEVFRLASASLDRLWDVWDIAPLSPPSRLAPPVRPDGHEIEFRDVCFSYDSRQPVLQHLSCRFAAGQMTAIVGASGSGKSTLLKLLAGIYPAQQGQIRIGGVDLADMAPADLAEQIAVVAQDVRLFSGTIADNIALSCEPVDRRAIRAAAEMAQATEFIEALPDGFDTMLGENGAGLSGGERQRLTIARAILKDSPILLLDEASSAIDALNLHAFQQGLQQLRQHKTLIVVTHRLETVIDADHILVLGSGPKGASVIEQGRHDALMAQNGMYRRLFQARDPARDWTIPAPTSAQNTTDNTTHDSTDAIRKPKGDRHEDH